MVSNLSNHPPVMTILIGVIFTIPIVRVKTELLQRGPLSEDISVDDPRELISWESIFYAIYIWWMNTYKHLPRASKTLKR